MDICTLVLFPSVTLNACFIDGTCRPSLVDETKIVCTSRLPVSCATLSRPAYECKRPDGTTYTWDDDNAAIEASHD
jgi:hypothetical protein